MGGYCLGRSRGEGGRDTAVMAKKGGDRLGTGLNQRVSRSGIKEKTRRVKKKKGSVGSSSYFKEKPR